MSAENLKGRYALVTGASSGLGVDFARELASRGCNLILVARREDRLQSLQQELTAQYDEIEVTVTPLDLTASEAPQRLYDQILKAGKSVDILVNNAGFGVFGTHNDIPWEKEKNMLLLDIVVVAHLTKLFLKDMLDRNFGYILQVSSIGAYQPSPTYASYSATKSFVLSFGEALNYELRNTNVSCTVVSPGVTQTEFLEVAGQEPTLYQRTLMMKSPDVVRIGIKSMLKRKSSVIPGRLNALLAWSNRFVPRRLSAALTYRFMTLQ
ncbi:SDR family NAD(P)-dependent oxidoreductase [candidate division CSSED10-310 bacterium]|uniref:SDR family NAD(P)-dependent oxidoreductase n=1 Tax=candidate division CSSED10-310 bacterium TaxID=2855610 RepID=A0ABV6Z3Z7_UNCC1